MISLILILKIALGVSALGGVIWAWKEGYIQWATIRESFNSDGLKEMVATIFSEPKFVFIYMIFVLFPIWVLNDYIKLFIHVPIWEKIMLSVGGIFAVNQIMIAKEV